MVCIYYEGNKKSDIPSCLTCCYALVVLCPDKKDANIIKQHTYFSLTGASSDHIEAS